MFKQLTSCMLALTLATATTAALADSKHDRDRHAYKGGHHGKHYQPSRHHAYRDRRHHYSGHRYQSRPRWRPPVTRIHHHYHNDYSSFFGAALVGSAISYSLFHHHDGISCHDRHDDRSYRNYRDTSYQVVGCHRIERLADGSERRVSVPLAQCH